ncbi:hypothetical protein QLX67_09455, partial [Balneolaceae bacterium ANBcel3]|nr:hypothetical protein [Balneolaceae bacterium ANBcel3]
WIELRDQFELVFHRYCGRRIEFLVPGKSKNGHSPEPFVMVPTEKEVLAAICGFCSVVLNCIQIEKILHAARCRDDVMVMISLMEPGESLTPFEHYYIMHELMRRDIYPDFLAPGDLTSAHLVIAHNSKNYGLRGLLSTERLDFSLKAGVPLQYVLTDPGCLYLLEWMASESPGLFRKVWTASRYTFFEHEWNETHGISPHLIPKEEEFSDAEISDLIKKDTYRNFLLQALPKALTSGSGEQSEPLMAEIMDFYKTHQEACMEKAAAGFSEMLKREDVLKNGKA